MTLPSTPPLTLVQIQQEFGAPFGTPLTAFVRGGEWVDDTAQNAGVPTTPPIAILDLLGAGNVPVFPEVDLQQQCDVNTRGRTDDAPFEWISALVGTNIGTNGAPTPTIGAAGDGGFIPMAYDNSLGTGNGQMSTLPAVQIGYSMFEQPFTMAWRFKQPAVTIESHIGGHGNDGNNNTGTEIENREPNSAGECRFRYDIFNQAENATSSDTPPIDDDVEHVVVCRVTGNIQSAQEMQIWIDGVLRDTNNYSFGNTDLFTRSDWSFNYRNSPPRTATADIFWSALWDVAITDSEILTLDDVPNPFV